MFRSKTVILATMFLATLVSTAPLAGALERVREGIYRYDSATPDDLLTLSENPDVRVLIVDDERPKVLTEAHLTLARDWVRSGGVLWAVADGLESAVTKRLAPFEVRDFDYRRPTDGKRGGDLILRGVSSRLKLGDGPLMRGVDRLYVFPRRAFGGTADARPMVEMTDTRGRHGLVMASVEVGDGLLVLDGTARDEHFLFGKLAGFDEDHPNALERDGEWNSYDWDAVLENASRHAFRSRF